MAISPEDFAGKAGVLDQYQETLAKAHAEHPDVDFGVTDLYRAQILLKDMPNDPSKKDILLRMALVAEPEALESLDVGLFDDSTKENVPKHTEEVVILPSVCFFIDGRIRRGVVLTGCYGLLSGIKLAKLAGGSPKLLLALPQEAKELTMDEVREGLNRLMRMQMGVGDELPNGKKPGPLWSDPDIYPKLLKKDEA